MAATRLSARRRTAKGLASFVVPLALAGACYGFGVQDWMGARTAGAEWFATQISAAAAS